MGEDERQSHCREVEKGSLATRKRQRTTGVEVDSDYGDSCLLFSAVLRSQLLCLEVKYVLEELQGYASLRDPETGIEVL